MNNKNKYQFEIIKSETVYDGFLKLVRHTLKHSLFGGGWSKTITREVLERRQAVAILLHDVNRDEVVLVEQFRVGAMDSESPWVLELVAGLVEPGETLEDVACREAAEESGVVVNSLQEIAQYYTSVGGTNEKTTVFYAEVDASNISGVYGLRDENEDILVRKIPTKDLFRMLDEGRLITASLVIAVQWLRSRASNQI